MARFLVVSVVLFQLLVFPNVHARDLDKLYPKCSFKLGSKNFAAYVADNEGRRADGLMFIKKLKPDMGMLFVFEEGRPLGFWMKNTLIPLSIGFFSTQASLLEVKEMVVADSIMDLNPKTYFSKSPALFALEMSRLWFSKNKISPGATLSLTGKCSSELLAKHLQSMVKSGQ